MQLFLEASGLELSVQYGPSLLGSLWGLFVIHVLASACVVCCTSCTLSIQLAVCVTHLHAQN